LKEITGSNRTKL